jgi:DNA-directed RNA polymerase specialized sigma24 family protein
MSLLGKTPRAKANCFEVLAILCMAVALIRSASMQGQTDKLPTPCQQVAQLHYLDEFTYERAARDLLRKPGS